MTITPVRLRLSRARGFDLHATSRAINGLYVRSVTRPNKWGNIWSVGLIACNHRAAGECSCNRFRRETAAEAVAEHRRWLMGGNFIAGRMRRAATIELQMINLACWCGLCAAHAATGRPAGADCAGCAPCHADTLLEFANPTLERPRTRSEGPRAAP
jgi:hypothetical protein